MQAEPLKSYYERIRRYLSLLFSQCIVDQCTQTAAALTFNTLLAMVPLVAIGLLVFQSMPMFTDLLPGAQELLLRVFTPTISSTIEEYLLTFANKASGLANISIAIFFVTALLILNTIDRTLNRIWHVNMERGLILTFFIYLGILVFAPILIGLSIAVTTYVISLPYIADALVQTGMQKSLIGLLPNIFTAVFLVLLYKTVPNVHVAWRHAVIGGMIAAILVELAKKAFTLYLTWFPTYELVYGSMAAIPLLLLWIYVSWILVLLGAQITYVLGQEKKVFEEQGPELVIAVQVLAMLSQTPAGLTSFRMQIQGHWSGVALLGVLGRLKRHGIIRRHYWGRWELLQDLEQLTLYELYEMMGEIVPNGSGPWVANNTATQGLAIALSDVDAGLQKLKTYSIAATISAGNSG